MTLADTPKWQLELESIRLTHGQILRAHDVVAFAADPSTELHRRFIWDDTVAAHQFRLWQARQLIRTVVVLEPNMPSETHVYVSLGDDRKTDGGGYRALIEVMSDEEMRAKLFVQAKREAREWQQKYRDLERLAPIFTSMSLVFETEEDSVPV